MLVEQQDGKLPLGLIHGITHFIDRVHNRKRLHAALGHLITEQFEGRNIPPAA